ncbi:MAG: aminotransferase class I/II-fold pyridoxal phosphate-dependent enzyme, partial [Ghiorsea sp.]|nr:aminotransferase class I/II-fold pyridoxal phosphate-dependent enzyme [Ghiorsea sp.]
LPSQANFIFATHPDHDAKTLALSLRQQGIIVRHFEATRINMYLRISIGTAQACEKLIKALKNILI